MRPRNLTVAMCLFSLFAGALCAAAFADTWYVDKGNTSGPWNGTTWPTAFAAIQDGIDTASDTDEVIVAEGTYIENISFNGKNITLQSTDPTNASVVAATIIDGNHVDSVVTFAGTETSGCVLSGFTITNGDAYEGGGIYGINSTPTIRNNVITDNEAGVRGGGLFLCNGIIEDNIITDNWSGDNGGGLYGCAATIQNNIVSGNSASHEGGAFYDGGTLQNNLITGNSANLGGALAYYRSTIRNNTIYGNSATSNGGGLYRCTDTSILNCIIWQNTAPTGAQISESVAPTYCCIQDWTAGGTGNISDDPLLTDPENGNLHLLPLSPCVDAGASVGGLTEDFDGDPRGYDATSEPRGDGSDFDIGADEYVDDDGDGLLDYWEMKHFGDLSHGPDEDYDGDGLDNSEECIVMTNPAEADSDSDGLNDGDEITLHSTDPLDPDSDNDGLDDGDEIDTHSTDPNDADTDGDGYSDGMEVLRGSDPTDPDSVPPPITLTVPGDYATIQAAIDAAFDSDEIVVSPGTYVEYIYFHGKNIVLRSTDPGNPGVVAGTIIDGNRANAVVTFSGTETSDCVLSGFTITNGRSQWGGGILGTGTSASIRNNTITSNIAEACGGLAAGGGIYGCHGLIENNIITSNSARVDHTEYCGEETGYGGGLGECGGTIQNNIIAGNFAQWEGGGLWRCYGVIRNNTIYDNSSFEISDAGGLGDCSGTITNCVIWANSGQLFDCSTPTYCCVQDWTGGGDGNISDDPLLVDPGNGDYHLQADSLCIDAGGYVDGLTEDFEGDTRPVDAAPGPRGDGSDFDIGADEAPFPDADSDGLPDYWEEMHGLDPDSSTGDNGPDGDPDEDGYTNLEEYEGGSNPQDADSVPVPALSLLGALLLCLILLTVRRQLLATKQS